MKEDSEKLQSCPAKNYRALMLTQMQVYRAHIDSHLVFHPDILDGGDPLAHFFNMFGAFFRQIFCTFACADRSICRVRKLPPFRMGRVYSFEELGSFCEDTSVGSVLKGCPHVSEQNAVQFYIASDPEHVAKHKYYHGIHGLRATERTKRHLLKMYGPLLRDMFCSAVCPLQSTCRRSRGACVPRRYA